MGSSTAIVDSLPLVTRVVKRSGFAGSSSLFPSSGEPWLAKLDIESLSSIGAGGGISSLVGAGEKLASIGETGALRDVATMVAWASGVGVRGAAVSAWSITSSS